MDVVCRSKVWVTVTVGGVLVLSMIACAGAGSTPFPPAEGQPQETVTGSPEEDQLPSGQKPAEAFVKWGPPAAYVALVSGICETLLAAEENLASGEITGIEAFGQAFLAVGMLGSLQEDLPSWVPVSGQEILKDRLLEHAGEMKSVLDSWLNQEVEMEGALDQLSLVCPEVEETYDLLLEGAAQDGLTATDIEGMIGEMSEGQED